MDKDFIIDGAKATFGIFSKDFQERVFKNSALLEKQIDYIKNVKNSKEFNDLTSQRYHGWTTYDESYQQFKNSFKLVALWLIMRELPLRHFYARSFLTFVAFYYFAGWNWKNNPLVTLMEEDKPLYYPSRFDEDRFKNYPMLHDYIFGTLQTKKNNPGMMEFENWNMNQYEPFYMHHIKHYRYILRNRRVIPWDGTFNQPVFPYLSNNDRTGLVHNGLNEIVESKFTPHF